MTITHRLRVRVVMVAAASALLLGACSAQPWAPPDPQPSIPPPTVAVARGDITSVVTAPVTVIASPEHVVLSPTSGRIAYPKKPVPGEMIPAGALLFTVDGQEVHAPRAGVIAEQLQPSGIVVAARVPVVTLRDGKFGVRGDVPIAAGYRMTVDPLAARVQLEPGLGVFECAPAHPRDASAGSPQDPRLSVLCLLDGAEGLVDGLPGTIGISMGEVHDVLTLPVTAVSGRVGTGQVVLIDGSGERTVPVELGLTDGLVIEIRSGLSEGDTVAAWAPGLVPAVTT